MGGSGSKREKSEKSKQRQDAASPPEHVVTAQSQSEAAGDEIPADNYLPALTHTWLPTYIDFDDGLLDELTKHNVINRERFAPFRVQGLNDDSKTEARLQLMNDVFNASRAQKELFLSALDETQQSHITNYIRHNGQRPADTDDNWISFEAYNVITEQLVRLNNLIDIECGLLDQIISAGILNDQQQAAVSANSSLSRNNVRVLLLILRRKNVADYKKFIDCLVKTKQFRVVSMLDPLAAANSPPLSEDQRAKLDANQSALVEMIDTRHSGLLEELRAMDCLTFRQKEYIESTQVASDRTRRLLDIMRRGCQSDYDKFILCLGRTGQQYVSNVLLTDTAVSQITAHGPAVDKYQSYVVEAFRKLLQSSPEEVRPQLVSAALGPDNEVMFMKTNKSITLFIASRSLSGLMQLHDIYRNGQLHSIIQHIFSELLENKHLVIIDELTWDSSDYNKCMQHLSEVSDLSVYPKIYQYSSDTTDTEPPVCSLIIDRFPHEVIEMLLLRAACQLFISMKGITTNAATYAHVTLSAVCRYWWQTLSCRRSNKRRLRRYFTQLCRPFTFNPRPVTSLQIDGKNVAGVVAFDSNLYVAFDVSNTIDVYDLTSSSSYNMIERIKVPDLLDPIDLVVCSMTRCLFVSDGEARGILRVNLLSDSNVVDQTDRSPFIPTLQYIPHRLSVQSERLLVTVYGGNAFHIYNIGDVERSQRINLPDYMNANQAVETSRETFVVAHDSRWPDDPQSDHAGVSELSADGHVIRVYKGPPTPFSRPIYLTVIFWSVIVTIGRFYS